jgi:hypothetical protein
MKKLLFKLYILIITFSIVTVSCADLEVINEMEPDRAKALSSSDDVMSLGGGTFQTWHNIVQEYDGVALAMGVMADHVTCSWGNQGMRDLSWEPRINSFNNSLTYSYFGTVREQWQNSYSAISAANVVLQQLYNEDMQFGIDGADNALVEAFNLFASGVAHGYLGLVFDQAMVVPYDADLTALVYEDYSELITFGLGLLDQAIAIADANTFDVPLKWVGGVPMTNVEFSELANGYAARILAYSSRTKAQNDAIDWNQVLTYASNGLSYDFAPELGDAYDWYDMYWVYARLGGWGRVDMRIINLMNHDYPSRWPSDNASWNTIDGMDPGPSAVVDARITTDFEYLASNSFPPDRGYYHYSHYRFKRYDAIATTIWYGNAPKPSFLEWESRLLEAEALHRTGNTPGALAILNDPTGPRKVRGMLPDLTAADDVLRYILDEKEIECYLTGAGVPFYDMRRTDRLQPATLLHFPVPATELEISNLPVYTINAVADGVDGSAGNWTGWDVTK